MNKILFLSNQLPNNFDAGGILYSDIIQKYGVEKLTVAQMGGLECGKCHY